jgi:hypothetical protein
VLRLRVAVEYFLLPTLLEKVYTPGEPWDVAWLPHGAPYPDSAGALVPLLRGTRHEARGTDELGEATIAYPARPSVLFVYVEDVDTVFRGAVAAGATPILEPGDQAWGDRVGGFHEPFDNRWWVGTRASRAS